MLFFDVKEVIFLEGAKGHARFFNLHHVQVV